MPRSLQKKQTISVLLDKCGRFLYVTLVHLQVNTAFLNRNAHSSAITSLQFSYEANTVLTRGRECWKMTVTVVNCSLSVDDTLKLWDLRKFKDPVHVAEELDNLFSVCVSFLIFPPVDILFSANGDEI